MKKQEPRKTIGKKQYQRSKWDDFNKVKVTFILKQFRQNISKYAEMMESLGYDAQSITSSPLTRWLLSLPKTQGRSQEIVRLAFVHNYGYTLEKGTEIRSFKNDKNRLFNQYLRMERDLKIGIDNINLQRQKHRKILRYTTEDTIYSYITKKNQAERSKRQRFTKKDIKQNEEEEFLLEMKKFFNQLIKEPTKEEIAQEYEDPEEFDEFEKEYLSNNEIRCGQEDSEENQIKQNPQVHDAISISALILSPLEKCKNRPQQTSQLIRLLDRNNQNQCQDLQYIPSPIQSLKSFSLSFFDRSSSICLAHSSQDQSEKIEQHSLPNRLKKTSSQELQKLMLKKMSSINLSLTDQQFELCHQLKAQMRRQDDLCDLMYD